MTISSLAKIGSLIAMSLILSACAGTQADYDSFPGSAPGNERINGSSATIADMKERGSLLGDGGLFGSGDNPQQGGGSGIGVNSFLWRASLDTLSFMPLSSADPFGGVIITDWYSPAETPNERFKITTYILGTALRSDGVRVSVFRQVRAGSDQWADAVVEPGTATAMEDSILTRARQLRIDTAAGQ
ncbi:DUF3576 domain-containing protein [Thalassospira sp.]|uniref:DUF3576 domain-containing protein n=1 Tax=Thalassospira sp. TaxID=1912094 RepID=UPI00273603FF|nr:DUF3576 domain-containing protein [Thalassospira sp.]MDP2699231.1 DUF3576 domain-containing protein [Thalassospira sp.]